MSFQDYVDSIRGTKTSEKVHIGSSGSFVDYVNKVKNDYATQQTQQRTLAPQQILQKGQERFDTVNAPVATFRKAQVAKNEELAKVDLSKLKSEIDGYSSAVDAYNNWKIPNLSDTKPNGERYTSNDIRAAETERDNYISKVTGGLNIDETRDILKIKTQDYNEAYNVQAPKLHAEQFVKLWDLDNYSYEKSKAGLSAYNSDKETEKNKLENKKWWETLGEQLATVPSTDSVVSATVGNVRRAYEEDTTYKEPSDEWNNEQRNIFGYLYSFDKNKAHDYAIQVNNSINKAKTDEQRKKIEKSATSGFWSGAANAFGAVLSAPLGLADWMDAVIETSVRGKATNKGFLTPHDYSETVTGVQSKELNKLSGTLPEKIPIIGGKGLGDVYGLATSMVQSSLAAATGSSATALISFFGSAAASGMKEARERGVSDDKAVLYGFAAGLAEAIPEMLAVDKLLNLKASDTILKKLNSQGLTEGLTEGMTSVLTQVSDNIINGDFSQYNTLKQQYIKEGLAETDAEKKAWSDIAGDIAFDTLAGYAMGGIQAAPIAIGQAVKNRKAESNLNGTPTFSFGVTQKDIDDYVDNSYSNTNTLDYKKYAEVSDRLAFEVDGEIDLTGYVHALRDNDIRHIKNSHGEATNEKYPVTKEDIKQIPNIVENYDKVIVFNKSSNKTGLVYVKVANDGLVYYLEQVTTKYGNEPLLVNKQMIKTGISDIPNIKGLEDAINKKQKTAEFLADLKVRQVYAQSVYQQSSTSSISNSIENVNGYKKETSQTTDANSPGATPNSGNASISSNNTVPQSEQTVNNIIPENSAENSSVADNNDTDTAPTSGRVLDMSAISVKAQNYVKSIGRALGRNVEFVNMEKFLKEHDVNTEKLKIYPEGAIDSEGNIYLWYNAKKPVQFLFKHELTHFGERSKHYGQFVEFVRNSKIYHKWLREKTGLEGVSREKMEAALMEKHRKAQKGLKKLSFDEARAEIIADFVGEKCFGEKFDDLNQLLNEIDTKKYPKAIQFFVDFFSYLKKKLSGNKQIIFELSRIEDSFRRLISDANNTKTSDIQDGGLKYSIATDSDGEFVRIDTNQEIFDGKSTREMQDIARKIIRDNFRGKVLSVGEDGKAFISKRSSDEYAYPANRRMEDGLKESKMRAAPELDNLLTVSEFLEHQNDDGRHPQVTGGWDVYSTRFEVGGTMFSGEVKIMVTDRGYLFHDITKIKRLPVNGGLTENNSAAASGNPSIDSITDNGTPVNSNSMQESENYSSEKNDLKFSVPTATESDIDTDPESTDYTAEFKELMQSFQNGEISQDEYMRRMSELYQRSTLENVIDLSNNNELSRKIGDLHGSDKYKAIQSYILDVLSEQPIVLSDGKNAVVDRSDALHIANKSGNEKTAQIAQIKQLVENAVLYAEDNKVEHNKFNYFCYYKAKVKYGKETFDLFLNVGRAKNDGEYHIYDITKKIRDTAHRINGVERPKPNEGYALENDVSINNIPKANQNVNNNSHKDKLKFSIETESGSKTYTSTDFPAQQKKLFEKLQNGEMTYQKYVETTNKLYEKAINENGEISQGEMVAPENKPFAVPKSVKEGTKVRQHVSRILESGRAKPEHENVFREMILDDKFSYTPTSNEANIKKADKAIQKEGYEKAKENWFQNVSDWASDANTVAKGEALLQLAFEQKNAVDIVNLATQLAELGTYIGQGLQAMSLVKRMGGLGQLVYLERCVARINRSLEKKIDNGKAEPVTIDETLAQQLAESKTEAEFEITYAAIVKDIAAQVPPTFADKWNAMRYVCMLFSPVTHIRNIVGNAIFLPGVRIKDLLAVAMEQGVSKDKRTKVVKVQKAYQEYAEKDFDEVADLIAGTGKYNPSDEIRSNQRVFKAKWLETVRKFNFELLEKEDALFLKRHYKHALGGYLQAQGIDLREITPKQITKAREYAMQEAMKATYRDASKAANMISRFAKTNAATEIFVEGLLPYKKTPINIIKRGVEYSPIGLIKTLSRGIYDLKKGKITVTQFIDGLASSLTGTGICIIGALLTSLGLVKGGFDDEEKWFRKLNGEQEYSIEIGGVSYTIDWATPASIPLFLGVAIAEYDADEDADILSSIWDFGMASFEPLLNLSLLSGLEDAIDAVSYADDGEKITSFLGTTTESYFAQFLPSVFGKTANLFDNTRRTTYIDRTSNVPVVIQEAWNKIVAKLPVASQTRAEYVDAWGETQYTGNFIQRFFQQFVSPGYASTVNVDDVSDELMRLYRQTNVSGIFPSTPQKYFKIRGVRRDLSQEEYFSCATFRGQTQADLVDEAIHSKEYAKLTDEQKTEVIKDIYSYAGALAKCQLDYSYEEVAAMEGEDTKGNLILTEEKYNRLDNKARQILIDEYFMEGSSNVKAYKTAKNGKSVVEYFCKKVKE